MWCPVSSATVKGICIVGGPDSKNEYQTLTPFRHKIKLFVILLNRIFGIPLELLNECNLSYTCISTETTVSIL